MKKNNFFEYIKLWFCDIIIDKSKKKIVKINLSNKDINILSNRIVDNYKTYNAIKNYIDIDYCELALNEKFVTNKEEYFSLLNKSLINANLKKIKNEITEDKKIIQAVESLNDVLKVKNIYLERYIKLLNYYNYNNNNIININNYKLERDKLLNNNNIEISTSSEENYLINYFIYELNNLDKQQQYIENYIKDKMYLIAPNISNLIGSILGSKLIYMFKGLKQLAFASTTKIQVIGSEKSLFKHLRKRAPSPKHGIIFNHPIIKNSPLKIRGKVSRILSFSISLASRSDYFNKKLNEDLLILLNNKLKNIK